MTEKYAVVLNIKRIKILLVSFERISRKCPTSKRNLRNFHSHLFFPNNSKSKGLQKTKQSCYGLIVKRTLSKHMQLVDLFFFQPWLVTDQRFFLREEPIYFICLFDYSFFYCFFRLISRFFILLFNPLPTELQNSTSF